MKTRATCCLLLAAIAVACGAEKGGGSDVTDPDGGAGVDSGSGSGSGSGNDAGADGGSTEGSTLDGGGDASAPAVGDFCVEDGWCWQRPTPFGTSLFGVWGSAPDDVWAVGTRGTIVHGDGLGWKLVASGVRANLTAVWGTSKSDVWAVGDGGTVLHFDGKSWSSKASPTTKRLNAIRGASATDVYAVGDEDTRLHWDGATWTALPTVYPSAGTKPSQYGVWASAAGEVWSAGVPYLQSIPHRTSGGGGGGAWTTTTVDNVNSTAFKTVWGSGPSDVWMSGDPGGQGSLQRGTASTRRPRRCSRRRRSRSPAAAPATCGSSAAGTPPGAGTEPSSSPRPT
jgi:hypothetical protein